MSDAIKYCANCGNSSMSLQKVWACHMQVMERVYRCKLKPEESAMSQRRALAITECAEWVEDAD